MDKKTLYKENMLREYRSMYRAICRMISYHEKLTTDGFELTSEDIEDIQSIISKVDVHAIKRLKNWVEKCKSNI